MAAVIENEGQFLVVEEKPDKQIVFNQPAGHLEKGESLQDAIVREVREETAWEFIPYAVVGIYRWIQPDEPITFLRICFTGKVENYNSQQKLDDGIIRTHWLTRDELLMRSLRSPMVLRCIDDYVAGYRYPLNLFNDIQ